MKNRFSPPIRLLKKELEYRNYSPFTIRAYCEAMLGFEKHATKTIFDSSTDDLKDYLHYLITEKNCSTSYVNQNISAFKIFTEDVLKREWTGLEVKRPRPSKKIPEILSLEEVAKMIEQTRNLKHRTMIQTMYTAGLRRSELLQLKPRDINSEEDFIIVRQGKGRKDRRTILSKRTLKLLRKYYISYRPKIYLFEPAGKKGKK